jgi:fructose-specific phosphotransferase system IIC component
MRMVTALGPLTAGAGVVWALAQPYRVTLLHPHGQTFWWLLVEPPLLVIIVGLLFCLVVAPGLLEDLENEDAAAG